MNNNFITLFVDMSDEDKSIEIKLIKEKKKLNKKIDTAIEKREPLGELQREVSKKQQEIRDLKGVANTGERLPRNSTELANGVLLKAKKLAHLEIDFINTKLCAHRNDINKIKERIDRLISQSIERNLDKEFVDFSRAIEFWQSMNMFDNPEPNQPFLGLSGAPKVADNLIGYYIQKLINLQNRIGELNLTKRKSTQFESLISTCKAVLSVEDDNLVFEELFLMGQRAANLNNARINIEAMIAKESQKSAALSKADWSHELAQQLYLDYWVYGKTPTSFEVAIEYKNLILQSSGKKVSIKTISDQLTKQRKNYSKLDSRVSPVKQRGIKKKI